jgi:hypothetical protein
MGSLRWSNRSGKPSAKETCRGYASRTSCKLPEENSKRTQGLFELDNLRLREASYVRQLPPVVSGCGLGRGFGSVRVQVWSPFSRRRGASAPFRTIPQPRAACEKPLKSSVFPRETWGFWFAVWLRSKRFWVKIQICAPVSQWFLLLPGSSASWISPSSRHAASACGCRVTAIGTILKLPARNWRSRR